MRKQTRLLLTALVIVAILSGCQPAATQAPTAVPPEEPVIEPTQVPEPTVEPVVIVENPADTIFTNGVIYTVDANQTVAEALAIKDGKIQFVGSTEESLALAGPDTKVIDLEGKFVLPGLMDAHNHADWAVSEVYEVALWGMASVDEYKQAIQEFITAHPGLTALAGAGWVNPVFPPEGPSKEILDELAPDIPVVLSSEDYHSVWVNSKTLELAGITKDTPNPDGGIIEKDANGEPNGTLRESAADLATAVMPEYTTDQFKEGLRYFQEMAHGMGYTAVFVPHLAGTQGDHTSSLAPLEEMEADGELSMHMRGALGVDPTDNVEIFENMVKEKERNQGGLFEVSAIKIFMDGVLEGSTAYLEQPYVHKPDSRGELLWDPDHYNEICAAAENAGFQIHVHSIGDASTRITLDGFAYAREQNGTADRRNMITHLQLVNKEDIARFSDLGVVAVPQVFWDIIDSYYVQAVEYVGQERADQQYPVKSFFDAGVIVAAASDYPVTVPFNPFAAIETGVTRTYNEGISAIDPVADQALNPDEAVTMEQMIAAYTINPAKANFMEDEIGSLEVGKAGDFIILDKNLLEIPASEIHTTQVLSTYFNGVEVYSNQP